MNQTTIDSVSSSAYAWRVVTAYTARDVSGDAVDPQPVTRLEFKRHDEPYWHTDESWGAETNGRPVPGAALRLAIAHGIDMSWI